MADKKTDEAVLTDAAKEEIARAVGIVASDRSYQDLTAIKRHLMPPSPENTPPKEGDPTPPPKKEGEPEPTSENGDEPKPKKKGLYWGDRVED